MSMRYPTIVVEERAFSHCFPLEDIHLVCSNIYPTPAPGDGELPSLSSK
jgi:hypothetical protein